MEKSLLFAKLNVAYIFTFLHVFHTTYHCYGKTYNDTKKYGERIFMIYKHFEEIINMWYLYTMEYFSAIEKNLPFETT